MQMWSSGPQRITRGLVEPTAIYLIFLTSVTHKKTENIKALLND